MVITETNALPATHSNESSAAGDTDFVFLHDGFTNTNSTTNPRKISSDYETQFDPPAAKVVYGAFEENDNFSQADSIQSGYTGIPN